MKKISNRNKLIIGIIALIIIVGVAITATIGLNFELKFQESKKIEVYIEKEFEIADIKQITNEVMPNQKVIIQKVEVYEDVVNIIAKDITDEQKANIITKINEKYQTELKTDSVQISTIPNTRGRDIVKPFIAPFVIVSIVVLAYMVIRYNKLNVSKVVVKTAFILFITQVLLLNLIAILSIPVGRLTMPMVIIVYLLTLYIMTTKFEKQFNNKKEDEENKNKKK